MIVKYARTGAALPISIKSIRSIVLKEVIIMGYFKCFECGHMWKIMFWEDGKGTKMACPECKSLNVHRIEKIRGWDREGKYATLANDEDHTTNSPGYEPV